MCRLAGYLGRPRSLAEIWLRPPHSLIVQSYAPKQMNGAILNADGFGMAWYTDAAATPAQYRTALPLWGDENVPRMAEHLVSRCAIANVRSATPGMSTQLANVSPFVREAWAFTHNGSIRDFRRRAMRPLRSALSDAAYAGIEGTTDSEHLFALFLTALEREPDPVRAICVSLEAAVRVIGEAPSQLNVLATDGAQMIATRFAVNAAPPTLYVRRHEGAIELASEPLDEHGWSAVEPSTLVVARDGEVRRESL